MKTNTTENFRRALRHLLSVNNIPTPVDFDEWDLSDRHEVSLPVPSLMTSLFRELFLVFRPSSRNYTGGTFAWSYTHRDGGSNGHDIGYVTYIETDDLDRRGWWMRDPDGNTTLITKKV